MQNFDLLIIYHFIINIIFTQQLWDGILPDRVVWCLQWNNVMDHNIVVYESEAACPLGVAVRQLLCISSMLFWHETPTVSPCRGNYVLLPPSYMCQVKSILQTYYFSFNLLTYHNRQQQLWGDASSLRSLVRSLLNQCYDGQVLVVHSCQPSAMNSGIHQPTFWKCWMSQTWFLKLTAAPQLIALFRWKGGTFAPRWGQQCAALSF